MDTFILGALDEEIKGIYNAMTDTEVVRVGPFDVCIGFWHGTRIFLCRSGVGKVNAAAACTAVLTVYPSIGRVIDTGVAGGIGKGVSRKDIVLGERTVYHDYDQTPDGLRLGQVQGFDSEFFFGDPTMLATMSFALGVTATPFHAGTIASGDQFIASKDKAAYIRDTFDALACDFESAAVAQVCALYGVPYLAMRAISDGGGEDAVESFYGFLESAAAVLVRALDMFLQISPAV